jgi:hypothetical protein
VEKSSDLSNFPNVRLSIYSYHIRWHNLNKLFHVDDFTIVVKKTENSHVLAAVNFCVTCLVNSSTWTPWSPSWCSLS